MITIQPFDPMHTADSTPAATEKAQQWLADKLEQARAREPVPVVTPAPKRRAPSTSAYPNWLPPTTPAPPVKKRGQGLPTYKGDVPAPKRRKSSLA